MLTSVAINRQVGGGKHGDILDAAEYLAERDYGSAANAIAAMVRQSPLFIEAAATNNQELSRRAKQSDRSDD